MPQLRNRFRNSRPNRYNRGKARGAMNVLVTEPLREGVASAQERTIEGVPQQRDVPRRGRGRGFRGFPRGGRGGSNSAPTHNDTGFNPNAAPFVPTFAAAPEFIERASQETLSSENNRGPQLPTGGPTYRENRRFAFDRTENQPLRPLRPEFRRGPASNAGANFNKTRGGQAQNRRKFIRRLESDDQSDQDKSMRERLMNQLESNRYECAICCQIILARQGIWSCKTCYHMFHISGGCIINWAKKSKEDDNNCHSTGGSGCGPCPSAPERITHCPCGRCTLEELGIQRKSCEDPIPTCRNICAKVLMCGSAEKKHRCRALCHPGECPPCGLNTSVVCRCKQVKRTLPCAEYVQFAV
ncbi:NF-X1 type zinc finger, partial [Ostertagia ostertagi]